MADALKRPLGHAQVRAWLGRAVASARLSGGYLFLGPEGIGKRGMALEFAAALRCARPREGWVCGECGECVRVAHGTHPSVRSFAKPEDSRDLPVELVREICDAASMTRLEPGRRIFIVDDADRFNESSANAFLKTLEEPPADLTFVLLAANSAQMLPTIVSRCQTVRFSPLSPAEAARAVAAFEGLPAGEERELLLRVAQGSPGRVARILELQALKLADEFIGRAQDDPFKASEALAAALAKGLSADAGVEAQRERLRDVLAVVSALLRERMVKALNISGVAALGRAVAQEPQSADALLVALDHLESLRERIDGNANLKLACDVLALGYPV